MHICDIDAWETPEGPADIYEVATDLGRARKPRSDQRAFASIQQERVKLFDDVLHRMRTATR